MTKPWTPETLETELRKAAICIHLGVPEDKGEPNHPSALFRAAADMIESLSDEMRNICERLET